MKLSLLTRDEREAIEQRVVQAFARGLAECESDLTWADPERKEGGWLTPLDHAYDAGREWGFQFMLDAP